MDELHHRTISCSVHEIKVPIQRWKKSIFSKLLSRIFAHCRKTFTTQLVSWMIYGLIVDNYSEFFIQKAAIKSEKESLFNTWFLFSFLSDI